MAETKKKPPNNQSGCGVVKMKLSAHERDRLETIAANCRTSRAVIMHRLLAVACGKTTSDNGRSNGSWSVKLSIEERDCVKAISEACGISRTAVLHRLLAMASGKTLDTLRLTGDISNG